MLTMIKIIYLTESIPSAMPMMMWLNSQAFFLLVCILEVIKKQTGGVEGLGMRIGVVY